MSGHYIPFYTSDFLGGTGGMTAATKGVYITLICLIYEAEAPLQQPWDALARRCGCTLPAFKKAVDALVDERKIEVIGGQIWSDKCAKHIAQRCERNSSAKAAANARWKKSKQNQRTSNASAMHPQCQSEPEPDNISSNEDIKRKRSSTPRQELETVLSQEQAQNVIDHRQRLKRPLTARAAKLLAGKLAQHHSPNEAADIMIGNGWQGFDVSWIKQRDGPRSRPNERDEAIREWMMKGQDDEFTSDGSDIGNVLCLPSAKRN